MKQIHIKLCEALHRELKIAAARHGVSMQFYVLRALQDALTKDKERRQTIGKDDRSNSDYD